MCGICGIVNLNDREVEKVAILQMMKSIKHRGPDDEGIFILNNIGLGFVRLSIIDLSPSGNQPMVSLDGRYVIIFNGEIYNYLELRKELIELGYSFVTKTDTEVLLTSFIHWGEDCLHRFNGMWAFVILDKLKNEIFGARDRFGVKPFYYAMVNQQFIFASDISAILAVMQTKPTANEEIVFDYLCFNRSDQDERTFFREVKKLQHGESFNLSILNHKLKFLNWYNLRSNLKTPFYSAEEFRNVFSSSIGLRLRSDVPIGVCFSGGLDSSSIVSTLIKDYGQNDIKTFSAVYGKGIKGDESNYIKEYDSQLKHMFFISPSAETLIKDIPLFVKAHIEPIPSTSPYAQYKVMELAKGNVVVTLDGQGSDEQLGGYHYFFGFYYKELLSNLKLLKLTSEIFSYIKKHKSLYGFSSMFYLALPNYLKSKISIYEKGYINKAFIKKHESGNSITSTLYSSRSLHDALLDHFEYKLEHLLKWEDRNSMWFSIEARTPFLDYRLVERTLSLPPEKVIKDGVTKHILREAMKGIVPEKIRTRNDKIGFGTPQGDWFRQKIFQSYILNIIGSKAFINRNILNRQKVEELYKRHLEGETDASNEIWKWIHLENWYRTYID